MIMGSKVVVPPICLFVFSIEDRGGAALLRGIEDDEASLLSDAPKASNLLLKSPRCRMINYRYRRGTTPLVETGQRRLTPTS